MWATPKNENPVVFIDSKRVSLLIIPKPTNMGQIRGQILDGTFNSDNSIDFVRHLIKEADKRSLVILGNLWLHLCKPVKAWLAKRTDAIEVFHRATYSQAFNSYGMIEADFRQKAN